MIEIIHSELLLDTTIAQPANYIAFEGNIVMCIQLNWGGLQISCYFSFIVSVVLIPLLATLVIIHRKYY